MSFIKAVFNLILPEIELIKLSIFLFFMLRVIHRIVSISSKILQKKVSFPQKVLKKLGMNNLRLYCSGTNLLCWSKFKMWDPELAGSGLNYPLQRVFNVGLNLGF